MAPSERKKKMGTRVSKGHLIVALAIITAACTKDQATDSALGTAVVATVNGTPLPESVFRVYALSTLRKNLEQLTPEEHQAVLDDLSGVLLLAAEAEAEGLLESRTLAAQLELNRLQLVARSMATSYLEKNPATQADLQKIYEENLPQLSPQQYKLRHILVATEAEANNVVEQLRQGKTFAALAQEHSEGPTGPNGGDLGWLSAESTVKPIADAMRVMQIGTYSQPVQTEYGYHVLLLEDTRRQEPPSLESIKSDLTTAVERRKLDEHLRALREAATITKSGPTQP
jgi:peptidyl-prolyl cis-trans isomerase C